LASSDFLQETVVGFLEEVASETPAPGGGAVAALVVALGASLVEMVAHFSQQSWDGAQSAASVAHGLRARVWPLAQDDAKAYEAFIAARRQRSKDAVDAAHARVVEVPLQVAAAGAEVAGLAAELAERGKAALAGDAVAGALAASAGAEISARLVELNLGGRADERLELVRRHAENAAADARRAQAAVR
jgi:methenyltetrahydrofolate cyclohydrolase